MLYSFCLPATFRQLIWFLDTYILYARLESVKVCLVIDLYLICETCKIHILVAFKPIGAFLYFISELVWNYSHGACVFTCLDTFNIFLTSNIIHLLIIAAPYVKLNATHLGFAVALCVLL